MDQFTEHKFLLSLDLEMEIVFCRVDCFIMCSKVTVPHFLCRGFSEGLSGVLCGWAGILSEGPVGRPSVGPHAEVGVPARGWAA